MCVRYLVLLVWFPGVLSADSTAATCSAPSLKGGYLVPEKKSYPHEATLSYSCDKGFKPAVEGWWATSTCLDGTWSPNPQCIDKKACIPQTFPNAKYTVDEKGWYEENEKIRITCDPGYEARDATAICINGTWTSVPVCKKSIRSCGEPPKIPHAVIILHGYQGVFADNTSVQYECENGYTVEGENSKNIYCINGDWTDQPKCTRKSEPNTGQGGSSSSSGPDDTGPSIASVSRCGPYPVVTDGVVYVQSPRSLTYKCAEFYELEGPETVVCYNTRRWSKTPTCKAAYCSVNTADYPHLVPDGVKFLRDGEKLKQKCVDDPDWWTTHYVVFRCNDATLTHSRCCDAVDTRLGRC